MKRQWESGRLKYINNVYSQKEVYKVKQRHILKAHCLEIINKKKKSKAMGSKKLMAFIFSTLKPNFNSQYSPLKRQMLIYFNILR